MVAPDPALPRGRVDSCAGYPCSRPLQAERPTGRWPSPTVGVGSTAGTDAIEASPEFVVEPQWAPDRNSLAPRRSPSWRLVQCDVWWGLAVIDEAHGETTA